MPILHTFQSAIADDPTATAAGEVTPSKWNEAHDLSGLVIADVSDATATGKALVTAADAAAGRTTLGLGALATVTPGTGIATALAVNVGSAGAPVVLGGALGTPSSGVATNLTGTAASLTAGNATTLATARAIYGNNFDGSAALTQIIASTYGGTGNGFTKFSGPASSEKTFTLPNSSDTVATAAQAMTWTAAHIFSDQQVSRAMLIDCGATYVDKGNSGTSTQTIDYTAGSHQKITATGNFTIASSNWPPTGNLGAVLLEAVNFGANTVTWPTINWIKPDGTTTTSVSTWLAAWTGRTAFQSSGTDWIKLWSRDAGSTIYGNWAA